MKKIITSVVSILFATSISAQTMYICQGAKKVAVPAEAAGRMEYVGGTTLNVMGNSFATAEIDSIVFDNVAYDATAVRINFDTQKGASMLLPIDLYSTITNTFSANDVVLTSSATADPEVNYILTGTASDGSFTLNGEYKCGVTLAGLNLTSQKGAAIAIENGKRINIELAEGTENYLTDFAGGTQDACLYVKGHPEFCGAGKLYVNGLANHAIKSKEYMLVKRTTGEINILSAKNDGIHVGQYFEMNGGVVSVKGVAADGIQAEITKDVTDERNGQILIHGGNIKVEITAGDAKGMKSDSLFTITGGTFDITASGDGSKGISTGGDLVINSTDEVPNIKILSTGGKWTNPLDSSDTSKSAGIKVTGSMWIYAGVLNVTATGDKGKSINIDYDYHYSSNASITTSPVPSVGANIDPNL